MPFLDHGFILKNVPPVSAFVRAERSFAFTVPTEGKLEVLDSLTMFFFVEDGYKLHSRFMVHPELLLFIVEVNLQT